MKLELDGKEIAEISKMNLKENDVIVVDFKGSNMPLDMSEKVSHDLKTMFPDNKIVILSGGVELKIIEGGNSNE